MWNEKEKKVTFMQVYKYSDVFNENGEKFFMQEDVALSLCQTCFFILFALYPP